MSDSTTQKPIRVSIDATTGPYIMVLTNQLDRVRERLEEHRVLF